MHDDDHQADSEAVSNATIDRRDYLRLTGAVAASATGVGAVGNASAADYETVTVAAGETRSWSLSDGDTLENVLIDITADGAQYNIHASGDDWAIRNVGVRGTFEAGTTSSVEPITIQGNGTIENVYLGDGGLSSETTTGVFVLSGHSGRITIDRLNLQGWPDNGLYGSSPGNGSDHPAPGGGGTVEVTNSYSAHNGISNFRLGTTGSYLENCVSVGGEHRSYWGYYEDTELRNCDLTGPTLIVGEDNYEKGTTATVTATDCRYDTGVSLATSTNEFYGSSQGSPDTSLPDGVPTTAEEAASGTGSGGGGGGGGTSDHRLEIVAADDASEVSYTFDVYGSVSKVTDNGDNSAESNDSITDNGDGTYTVEGLMGNGYGDTFDFSGNVFSWSSSHSASAYTLYLDGTAVTPDELTADRFEIVAGTDASEMSYEFTVDGTVTKVTDNGDDSAESNDTITDNGDGTYTVGGVVGNGYGDTFDFDGTRSGWWSDHADSAYTLYTNGSETRPEDIGGGGGGGATVVDDFEDGDLSEYDFDRGSSGASVVSSPTHSGSYALEYAGTSTEAISTSGLNAYPSAGDTFSFRVRGSGGAAKTNLTYGVQDHRNRYFVRVNVAEDSLALYRYEAGSGDPLATDWSTPTLSQDEWYEVEVQWGTDGTHTVTLFDASGSQVAQISGSDSTWTSGGVGYDAYLSLGQRAYFDDVTIE